MDRYVYVYTYAFAYNGNIGLINPPAHQVGR